MDHSEIFLEEPEDNHFLSTQCQFVNWVLEKITVHNDMRAQYCFGFLEETD